MQHLPGNVMSFRRMNDSLGDDFGAGLN